AQTQRARRARPDERVYQDRISKQAAAVRQHYRLSAREAEVMELIARGNTVARIAEDLVVSENTIRTHSKRIYAKLDIHKKQELLDLIDAFDPHELEEREPATPKQPTGHRRSANTLQKKRTRRRT